MGCKMAKRAATLKRKKKIPKQITNHLVVSFILQVSGLER